MDSGEESAEERRAQLNAEAEALVAEGGHDERVAELVEEMAQLLGGGGSSGGEGAAAAGALLRPVVWGGLSFGQRWAAEADALGLSVWRGARELADWLAERPERVRGRRVLELGCGAGLAGCAAAALGAASVLLTDTARVLPLALANVTRNGLQDRVACRELLWGATAGPPPSADLVLGAELVARLYDSAALLATLAWLAPAPALLAYQRHDPTSPALFLRRAAEAGFRVHVHQQGQVEIVELTLP